MSIVAMKLDTLVATQPPRWPPGLHSRAYRSGDQVTWMELQASTGIYDPIAPDLFVREFGSDDEALAERQRFLVTDEDHAIATASLWFPEPSVDPRLGRVHWVAVRPSHQRSGLGSALVVAVCELGRSLGYTGASLTTGATNFAAVSCYWRLGFRPMIQSALEAQCWSRIAETVPGLRSEILAAIASIRSIPGNRR